MLASIIIITKNQKHFLTKTIPFLLTQKLAGDYEIVVVDSGSTDGAIAHLKKQPVKLVAILPEEFTYGYAFNKGANEAKGRFLIRLSGDCIPIGNDWLNKLLSSFTDDNIGAVYGRYTISGKKGWGYPHAWPRQRFGDKSKRFSFQPYFAFGLFELGQKRDEIFNLAGGCCVIRRSIWQRQPFIEELKEAEDAIYAWSLHVIGYDIVYNAEVLCLHEHRLRKEGISMQMKQLLTYGWAFYFVMVRYWIGRLFLKKMHPFKYPRNGAPRGERKSTLSFSPAGEGAW